MLPTMPTLMDPMLALNKITSLARTNSPYTVSYNVDSDGGVFNGHGAAIADVLAALGRATRCYSLAAYSMYGYQHTVNQEAAAGMTPPEWALPSTLASGQSVMVLVSLSDTPSTDSLNVQGLADANGLVTQM
jgi:hypothetical protein